MARLEKSALLAPSRTVANYFRPTTSVSIPIPDRLPRPSYPGHVHAVTNISFPHSTTSRDEYNRTLSGNACYASTRVYRDGSTSQILPFPILLQHTCHNIRQQNNSTSSPRFRGLRLSALFMFSFRLDKLGSVLMSAEFQRRSGFA